MKIDIKNCKIAVIGGDARMLYCAINLAEKGIETAVFGFDTTMEDIKKCTRCKCILDALYLADIVILPMPVSSDGINLYAPLHDDSISLPVLFSMIDKKCLILGGNVSDSVNNVASEFGLTMNDYFTREEVMIANAYLTAGSAVEIAMTEKSFPSRRRISSFQ